MRRLSHCASLRRRLLRRGLHASPVLPDFCDGAAAGPRHALMAPPQAPPSALESDATAGGTHELPLQPRAPPSREASSRGPVHQSGVAPPQPTAPGWELSDAVVQQQARQVADK